MFHKNDFLHLNYLSPQKDVTEGYVLCLHKDSSIAVCFHPESINPDNNLSFVAILPGDLNRPKNIVTFRTHKQVILLVSW